MVRPPFSGVPYFTPPGGSSGGSSPSPGGGSGEVLSVEITQAGHGFVAGDVVAPAGSNTYVKAQADDDATLGLYMVSSVSSVDVFSVTLAGRVTVSGVTDEDGNALTADTFYYVSATTAGKLTKTSPPSPYYVNPILYAHTATVFDVIPFRADIAGAQPQTPVWDDLRVADTQFDLANVNPPEPKVFVTTGATGSGNGINLETYTATIPSGAFSDHASDYSMGFWLKLNSTPTGLAKTVVSKSGTFEIRLNSSRELSFTVTTSGGTKSHTFPTQLTVGVAYCIVWVLEESGGDVVSTVYVNNISNQVSHSSVTLSDGGGGVTLGGTSAGRYPDVILDELRFWSNALDASNVSSFYNEGAGTTGGTGAGTLEVGYHFDEGTGTTAENFANPGVNDATLGDASMWDEGLIDSASGITALAFPPDRRTEFRVVAQLPHAYKEGSDIEPHIHYALKDAIGASTIKLTMQYVWANVNDDFGNTTSIEKTIDSGDFSTGDANKHKARSFGEIDGTGKNISSIFMAVISRDGDSSEDDFDEDVYILEFDIHYQRDADGSLQQYTK
jgi:hypothetical protein